MFSWLIFIWLCFFVLFLSNSRNLLLSLILLEIIGFFLIYIFSLNYGFEFQSDYLILSLFCVFVIEGVIALSGLIILVNFVGSDYVSTVSFLKL